MLLFGGFQPRPQMTGFTSIPNEFFECGILSDLKEAELKILLTTFRKTYGWVDKIENGQIYYKLEDDISYSQYRETTGLSDASIAAALKKLIQKGYMVRVRLGNRSGISSRYKIRIKGETPDDGEQMDFNESMEPTRTEREDIGTNDTATETDSSFTPDELFKRKGSTDVNAAAPRKKGSTQSRVVGTWNDWCRRKGFTPISRPTGKELKHVKDLHAEYGEDVVLKAVEFFILNFKAISDNLSINAVEPTLAIFFGFRKSIFPMAKNNIVGFNRPPAGGGNKSREFNDDKFGQGGGDFWQT